MEATGVTTGQPDYLVIGLAVGIPCGIIILVLVVLICVMIFLATCKSRDDEVEATYMRRRFQGLSLEEQRRRQKTVARSHRFVSRRRSSGTTDSRPSMMTQLGQNARVRTANPFGLQEWQLKLSGIDITMDEGETEETDFDSDSPRSPIGAINLLLLEHPHDDIQPSVHKSEHKVDLHPSRPHPSTTAAQYSANDSDNDSSDSFNPYD